MSDKIVEYWDRTGLLTQLNKEQKEELSEILEPALTHLKEKYGLDCLSNFNDDKNELFAAMLFPCARRVYDGCNQKYNSLELFEYIENKLTDAMFEYVQEQKRQATFGHGLDVEVEMVAIFTDDFLKDKFGIVNSSKWSKNSNGFGAVVNIKTKGMWKTAS